MTCPACGSVVEKHHEKVEEAVIDGYGQVTRKARPATFYACPRCEYCEEHHLSAMELTATTIAGRAEQNQIAEAPFALTPVIGRRGGVQGDLF
jgi:uncharacterized protein with PIN domain